MRGCQNVLVCITHQMTCDRLVKGAIRLNNELNGNLFLMHITKNNKYFLNSNKEGEALEYLFEISKSVKADLIVLKSDNILGAVADYVTDNKISYVVMSESLVDEKEYNFHRKLKKLFPDININLVL